MSEPVEGYAMSSHSVYIMLKQPEPSEWKCELFGCGESVVLHPTKGSEPNWFWRQMQFLCFGNRWVRETK